jgi:hypothetical protein
MGVSTSVLVGREQHVGVRHYKDDNIMLAILYQSAKCGATWNIMPAQRSGGFGWDLRRIDAWYLEPEQDDTTNIWRTHPDKPHPAGNDRDWIPVHLSRGGLRDPVRHVAHRFGRESGCRERTSRVNNEGARVKR